MSALAGTVLATLASIPSPSSNEIVIGPLHLRAYGLMIAIGVIVAVWIAQRRWAARGGDPDDITTLALWAVPAGLVGSRIYHVITDYNRLYCGGPECEGSLWPDAFEIWSGGLGIPGGILGGFIGAYVVVRVKGWPVAEIADVVAPAIPVAQAIGRLGNWFNQEVFGRPTDLPWGLEIDPGRRGEGYEELSTFHPTFLYEGLWNLALAYLLVRIDRIGRLRAGRLFVLYVGGYFLGRLWVEALRIDTATEVLGLRVNTLVSLLVIAAVGIFIATKGLTRPGDEVRPALTAGGEDQGAPGDSSAAVDGDAAADDESDAAAGDEHDESDEPAASEAASAEGAADDATSDERS